MTTRDFATVVKINNQYTERALDSGNDMRAEVASLNLSPELEAVLLERIEDYASDVASQHKAWQNVEKHPDFDFDYTGHWFKSNA